MALVKLLLKLVFWGAAAVAAVCGAIIALQKAGVLPDDYTLEAGPISLRVRPDDGTEDEEDEIDDDLI